MCDLIGRAPEAGKAARARLGDRDDAWSGRPRCAILRAIDFRGSEGGMAVQLFDLVGADDRRFSPYCWRAKMALAHKGLEFETIPTRFTDKEKLAFSGQKLVPVIKDGTRVVNDSWAIANYLEESYPGRPSLFGGSIGRAEAKFINAWVDRELQVAFVNLVAKDIYDHSDPADRPYFRETREKRFGATLEELHARREEKRPALVRALDFLRAVIKGQAYFAGDAPAYADYIVFGTFQWIRGVTAERFLEPGDALYDWRRRLLDLHGGLARRVNAYPE
jgi:glutathione S-transferase